MSSDRRRPYPFDQIEPKWQTIWDERQLFHAPNPGEKGFDTEKRKFYVLDMFPYPSGAGLHVGHPEGYTATDIVARYKRLRGFNVLHPMGWDAFGLPAEQYAIKTGQHPAITTRENVAKFKSQLKRIGFSYDWQREINTSDPTYYKWTQWIFLQIYNSWFNPETNRAEPISTYRGNEPDSVRLAYVADVPVNWCPELGTVLANEEVVDGKSEVGGFPVVRRPMRQWMLRITAYAERLLNELDHLDWPEGIKLLQRNWIGRSEGAEIDFAVAGSADPDYKIRVFTTRPDTLYGGTFLVLAPEHSLVDLIATEEQWPAVREYRERAARKSELERADLSKEKTGVFTGAYAINPATNAKIPIWIADYVLLGYGTGAIGGVPAHDQRDLEFAKKFDLPIVVVVQPTGNEQAMGFTGEGIAVNSPIINGLTSAEAKRKITVGWKNAASANAQSITSCATGYSRVNATGASPSRLFGKTANTVPWTSKNCLSSRRDSTTTSRSARANLRWRERKNGFVTLTKPCARRTPCRSGQVHAGITCGSAIRIMRTASLAKKRNVTGWAAINSAASILYVGGTEHAVLHLLYARFWQKVLFDLGYISKPEPFQRLVNQGIILGEDNQKMSKSRGNIVNPDEVIDQHGADAFRCYEMFMGPLEQMKPWSMRGVEGVARFLARVWRLLMTENQAGEWVLSGKIKQIDASKPQQKLLHARIKKVTEDIESFSFNTAISQMMIFVNAFTNVEIIPLSTMQGLPDLAQSVCAAHCLRALGEVKR